MNWQFGTQENLPKQLLGEIPIGESNQLCTSYLIFHKGDHFAHIKFSKGPFHKYKIKFRGSFAPI